MWIQETVHQPLMIVYCHVSVECTCFGLNFLYLFMVDLTGLLGILYISFATDLNFLKISFLLILLVIFSVISNLIISLFCYSSTKNCRRILDIYLNKRADNYVLIPEPNRNSAWKEIFYLPSRVILIDFLAMVLLVILPTMIISRIMININCISNHSHNYRLFHISNFNSCCS